MPSGDVTGRLRKWSQGDGAAVDQLTALVYSELRRLAHRYLRRERADHSLRSTELVHEAYLRLVDQKQASWQNRAHFFAVSGQIMRRILVDYARARHAEKRGGGAATLGLNEAIDMPDRQNFELIPLAPAPHTLPTPPPHPTPASTYRSLSV